jgi:hypothetical protein
LIVMRYLIGVHSLVRIMLTVLHMTVLSGFSAESQRVRLGRSG